MSNMTNLLENRLLDWMFRGQAMAGSSPALSNISAAAGTGFTSVYIALFTVTPTDTGGGTEVTGGSYARQQVTSGMGSTGWSGTQGAASTTVSSGTTGTISNNQDILFPAPTANWGTINGMAIFDALTGGNMLFWAPLNASKAVNNGDAQPKFAAGSLTIQIDSD